MALFPDIGLGLRCLAAASCLTVLTWLTGTDVRADVPFPAPTAAELLEVERAQRLAERAQLMQEQVALERAGKRKEAAAVLGKILEIECEVLGEFHEDVVTTLLHRARESELDENWAAARADLEQVLAIRQRQPERKKWRIVDARRALEDLDRRAAMDPESRQRLRRATALNRAVVAQWRQGKYAAAQTAALDALRIRRQVLGERHPDYTQSLFNLAAQYHAMGDYARAEPLYRQALETTKQALGERHPDYATSLNNLAALYQAMGDYARAEPLFRQAMEIRKQALGEARPAFADSLTGLAKLYESRAEYSRAEPLLCQALEIRKRALGEAHPDYAKSLDNLATLYESRAEFSRAEPLLRQALEIKKKAMGESHSEYGVSLSNLARLYRHMGDYARAEPLFRQALEIAMKAGGESYPDYATSLDNLAGVSIDMGDYARAEPLLRQALEIRKQALGERHPDYSQSLNNLALLYRSTGDYARAEPLLRQALEITKQVLGERHPDYATSLNNLAGLYSSTGDFARAEPLLREALEITKKALGDGHPKYARGLNNLAMNYAFIGDHARAEPLLREALEITKQALGGSHPDYTARLPNLAGLYYVTGDTARARHVLSESLERSDSFIRDTSAAVGERQRLRFLATTRSTLDAFVSLSLAEKSLPVDIYRGVLAWKGAVEAGQAEQREAWDQLELRPIVAQLAQVRARLAHLAFTTPDASGQAPWRRQLDALREQKENVEADLAQRSAAFRQQQQAQRLGPAEVAAALPDGIVLVDFFAYMNVSPRKGGKGQLRSEPRLVAFISCRDRPLALVPLGAVQPINSAVIAWRQALDARQGDALAAAAAELGRRIWEPLRPHLAGTRTVLVAPDGALVWFPLAALPGSRPGSYLIEDLAIGYVASGRQAVAALAAPAGPAGRGLLAAGAIDFQADPGRSAPAPADRLGLVPAALPVVAQRAGFRALPATGPEAQSARDLYHAAFADEPAEALLKAAPTEAELKRRLDGGRWRVLHLATHGFFESPARIAALRAEVRRDQPLAFTTKGAQANEADLTFALTPLLQSGVVLAGGGRDLGADQAAASVDAPPRDDGILTAEEVQALDLRGCELVVLSACETGLGHAEAGQGVLGLQRAFQAAGARAVVASLWKVDDAATGVLMEQFYTNLWTKKLPKLEALRRAQLAVLNDPGLVERHRLELAKHGLGPKAEPLPGGGQPVPPTGGAARSDPALWAAFLLGGDGR
jgi:CHAT domain-containing protein/Tfp pilus assembly protein PilF